MIRKATLKDLPAILPIYATARQYMRDHGNTVQWDGLDAPEPKLERDIQLGQLYVLEEDEIHAVFAFIIGDDPLYARIDDGSWRCDRPYGTIHRLGSDGKTRHVLSKVMDWAMTQIDHLRADTHASNATVQHALERCGFVRQGVIYVEDGTPRIAYEKV